MPQNRGDHVTVGGTHTTPGRDSAGRDRVRGPADGGRSGGNARGGASAAPDDGGSVPTDCTSQPVACRVDWAAPPAPPSPPSAPGPAGYPTVAVSDLASFAPRRPAASSEPGSAAVVGLPMNLYATASAHTLRGTVLGYPVQVRFTPDHFVLTYGDGASVRSASGGASWAASHLAQFSPTPTSHTYRARGVYTPTATVSYAATVAFPDGVWHPVAGYVTATGATAPVHVYEARTALVAHTCTQTPTAPGC